MVLLHWSPVAALAVSALLGTVSYTEFGNAKRFHDRAVGMINPDGTLNTSAATYNQALADERAANTCGKRAFLGAAGAAGVTAALYVGYRYTGDWGPIRF